MPKPFEELTPYENKRRDLALVLARLKELGGRVEAGKQKVGSVGIVISASSYLFDTPELEHLLRSSGPKMHILHLLKEGGWIDYEMNGKRVKWIQLTEDVPPEPVVLITSGGKLLTDDDIQKLADEAERGYDVEHIKSVNNEADELGMRPGRLAHRIEQSIPLLVKTAVNDALGDMIAGVLNSMGYYFGVSPEDYQQLEQQNEILEQRNALADSREEELRERIVVLEGWVDWLNEQTEARMLRSNEGQIASRENLRPSQLPEEIREYARLALEQGWMIRRTRGGHVAWRSPNGHTCIDAHTGSDPRGVDNHKARLRRFGLQV
jgi:predicted RNA binding protein YcfA (HicA-like mRNA interferase family)